MPGVLYEDKVPAQQKPNNTCSVMPLFSMQLAAICKDDLINKFEHINAVLMLLCNDVELLLYQ